MKSGMAHFLAFFALLAIPAAAFATNRLENPLAFNTLYEFLHAILRVIVMIATPVLVIFIIYIGMKFVTAQGNADKLKEVRKQFMWAIIGGLIVLGAEALSIAIENTVKELGA